MEQTYQPDTESIQQSNQLLEKPKYADYIHSDGRKWEELTTEEKQKVRKKLNKKDKKKSNNPISDLIIEAPKDIETPTSKVVVIDTEDYSVTAQINWCIFQIKLGLQTNKVTKDQSKYNFYCFNGQERSKFCNLGVNLFIYISVD